jgi:lipopolysaccharide assembly outer membrane protein LptD (OstA)
MTRAPAAFLACLALLLSACLSRPAAAQEEFDVSADRLVGSRQGEAEVVVLEGNVKIVHGATIATADSGFYDKQADMLRLAGNVVVRERDVEVRGSRCEYLKAARRVIFPTGIEVVESSGTLTAERGTYDIGRDSLEVEGAVDYSEGLKSLRADRAIYLRGSGWIGAWGNVMIEDSDYGASVAAPEVTYLKDKKYGVARRGPVLEIAEREGRQAMTVTADSMELFSDRNMAVAIGSVGISRGKADGTCGRAVFMDREDRTVLYESPSMTQEGSSVSGDSITIFSKDDQISHAVVSGDARCVYHPENGEESEITGTEIVMNFSGDDISEMLISGGAKGVFLPSPEDTSASRNEVHGRSMTLGFEGGEVKTATVVGGVKGTYSVTAESGEDAITGARDSVTAEVGEVLYQCDSLHYEVPEALMYLAGSAGIVYRGMRLESEAIEYNSRTYNLYATVDPILWEGEDKITGSSMSYNLKTKRGNVVAGRTRFDKGIYTGRLIRKTGETTLNVEGGTYTSCDYLDPHYTFTSSRMKIGLDDKVIARPVVLRLRGVPVLALPFYMFPIKRGRHSGLLVPRIELGFDQTKGRFIRNAGYYWAPNDYFDAMAWGDYYEKTRWVAHAETRYSVRYLLNGSLDGSFTKDVVTHNSRWDLGGSHTQNIGETGKLVTHVDFVSDKTYRRDTSDDLEKALRRVLESDAAYSRTWQGGSLSLAAARTENLDSGEISEKLPSVSVLLTRKTLFAPGKGEKAWHKGSYISASSSFASTLNEVPGNRTTRQAGNINLSLDSDLALAGGSQTIRSRLVATGERKDMSEWCAGCTGGKAANSAGDLKTDFIAKFNPGGWVNLNPSVTSSVTLYDEDKAGKRFPVRFMYWGGLDARMTLYRTYFPRIGALTALRHVIAPSVTFTHRPDFSEYKNRFYTLSGVSSEVSKSSLMNISLSNRLQAKLGSGADTRKINDLLSLSTSTTYDFLYRDSKKATPFSTILNSLRLYPTQYATVDLSFSHEPVHLDLKSFDLQTKFSYTGKGPLPPGFIEPEIHEEPRVPEEGVGEEEAGSPTASPWRFDVAYRYTKGFEGAEDNYWLEFTTAFNLTRNWRVEYGGRFDLSGKQTVYQEYSLYRDLHCWEARFVRRYSDGDWEYYVRINIKAHPEIYAERGLRALYRSY